MSNSACHRREKWYRCVHDVAKSRLFCDKNQCKNINDVMHILLAQKAKCKKLITFDGDFRKLDGANDVKVEIL